jgi:peptide/nickel transport system permease protein
MEVIGDRLPLTLAVAFAALVFTWLLGLPIGIYSAIRQYSIFDYLFTFVGFIGLAVPNFLLALTVLYIGFKYFDANVGGLFSAAYLDAPWSWGKVQDLLGHLPIPAVVLGVAATAHQPYVVAARARGVPEVTVILKYPVRVALNPFASQIPFILPQLVGGSIIVSVVLSLPTVGPLLYKALIALDMFLAGTIILLISVLTVIGSLISDLLLAWIDPRIRLEGR